MKSSSQTLLTSALLIPRLSQTRRPQRQQKKSKFTQLMETDKTIADLHGECDWLLKHFDARKAARAGEIASLGKAKDVLAGADYSLVQTASIHLRGARHA